MQKTRLNNWLIITAADDHGRLMAIYRKTYQLQDTLFNTSNFASFVQQGQRNSISRVTNPTEQSLDQNFCHPEFFFQK